MEKLLLIIPAIIIVFFGILYLTSLNSERKINLSLYWRTSKAKIPIDGNIRQEFQKDEMRIKTFKQLLQIVISLRNNIQKGLNELKGLLQQLIKKSQISNDDLTIMIKIDAEIHTIRNNFIQLKDKKKFSFSEELMTLNDTLLNNINNYEVCLQNILNACQSTLNNPEFISHEIQTLESIYKDIVEIHSKFIKQFQTNLS